MLKRDKKLRSNIRDVISSSGAARSLLGIRLDAVIALLRIGGESHTGGFISGVGTFPYYEIWQRP